MKKITLLTLYLFSLSIYAEVLWKPEAMSYELKQAHRLLGIGLMLELNQILEPSEAGWKQSRIDVPESWGGAKLEMKQSTLYITVGTQEYYLNPTNMGELSFAILDGGNKTDAQLLSIWVKYAKST
ncbi:MAG: hypothetical protein KJ856_00265 [Gammaproteobacteria bacterium]|nr:hypothetical protein [Gammaproteobacteria bacterium]MBU1479692.1 hypothetical protein [Gammaproteobacteria bacterium]MBU1999730.1 hypothetical protein [Gammaproteobacteria bacterium]MBU2133087.1 hypothetical protein [Gammaproteobacteria bacterium]MBU2185463.1 hypothetical protein [Gammaproteobacteria bacterium]